jgi:hypothetical protein
MQTKLTNLFIDIDIKKDIDSIKLEFNNVCNELKHLKPQALIKAKIMGQKLIKIEEKIINNKMFYLQDYYYICSLERKLMYEIVFYNKFRR